MPWITRGSRDGVLTSTWPAKADEYFDTFRAAVDVADSADVAADRLTRAADQCPTAAITVTQDGVQLDRGRCILCGRCVLSVPEVFSWAPGSAIASTDRSQLVVGDVPETDESLRELRLALAEKVRYLRRSVHIRHVDAGSTGAEEWEVQALLNPVYDIHRLGIFITASPRHADILLVTGIGAEGMAEPLRRTREAMPDPVVVIAAGADAVSGGLIGRGYTAGNGIQDVIDVDIWVPGSPPSPFSLMHAILLALDRTSGSSGRRPAAGANGGEK